MKLRRLDVRRLPGIDAPLHLEALPDGVIVISGPNASGKSSLLRALRHLLAPRSDDPPALDLSAEFDRPEPSGTRHWRVSRFGSGQSWSTRLGDTAWEASVAPSGLPDPDALEACFLQIDNLLDISQRDTRFLERVKRDMAGGFDLDALNSNRGPFLVQPGVDRTSARELADAEKALDAARAHNQRLIHERARLPELAAAIDAAAAAGRFAQRCRAASKLLLARRERRVAEQALSRFPAHMQATPGEAEFKAIEAAVAEAQARCDRSRLELAQGQERLDSTGIDPTAELPDIGQARRWLQALGLADQELTSAQQRCQQALVTLNARERQLGRPETTHDADSETSAAALPAHADNHWLHAVEQAAITLHQADQTLLQLSAAERVAQAQTGDTTERQSRFRQQRRRELIGLVLIASGAAATLLAGALTGQTMLTAAPLLVLIPGAWLMATTLGRSAPGEIDHAQQSALREDAERGRTAARETLSTLAADAGLDTHEPLLAWSTEQLARHLHALDAARERFLTEQACLHALRTRRDALRDQLCAFLETDNHAASVDTAWLSTRVDAFDKRINAATAAAEALSTTQARLAQEMADAARAEQSLHALFARCELAVDARDAMVARIALLPEWTQARDALAQARLVEQTRLAEFDDPDGRLASLVDDDDLDAIDASRLEADRIAEQSAALIAEQQAIIARIQEAERTAPLDAARAQRDRVADRVHARRTHRLQAELGRWLLASVDEQNRSLNQPVAIQRANDYLRAFTHDQFALEFDAHGAPTGRHLPSGQRRTPGELSVGTRMQLLIALRVAWLRTREGEGGLQLPLFLDEALTTTDPMRFHAIASALHALAADEQRQVFYLTAQAEDSARWRAAAGADSHAAAVHGIRLPDAVDTVAGLPSNLDELALELPEQDAIPRPDGPYPAAYARALGVPPIDPETGSARIHPFHILRDDLDLLYRLVSDYRIRTLGQLQSFLDRDGLNAFGKETTERLRLRLRLVDDWLRHWQIGRGRRLPASALHDSPVAGWSASLTALCERVEREGEDARRFIASLDSDPIPLIGPQRRETIRDWLIEAGYLDTREPLDAEERRRRLLGPCPPDRLRDVGTLLRGLDAGVGDAQRQPDRGQSASY